jgi:hypothetical protein
VQLLQLRNQLAGVRPRILVLLPAVPAGSVQTVVARGRWRGGAEEGWGGGALQQAVSLPHQPAVGIEVCGVGAAACGAGPGFPPRHLWPPALQQQRHDLQLGAMPRPHRLPTADEQVRITFAADGGRCGGGAAHLGTVPVVPRHPQRQQLPQHQPHGEYVGASAGAAALHLQQLWRMRRHHEW